MAQHFLLSTQARTMSLRQIFGLSDQAAFELFRNSRWGNGDEVACPECGAVDRHYFIKTRRQWRCKACKHTFSVTSGTIFVKCAGSKTSRDFCGYWQGNRRLAERLVS